MPDDYLRFPNRHRLLCCQSICLLPLFRSKFMLLLSVQRLSVLSRKMPQAGSVLPVRQEVSVLDFPGVSGTLYSITPEFF